MSYKFKNLFKIFHVLSKFSANFSKILANIFRNTFKIVLTFSEDVQIYSGKSADIGLLPSGNSHYVRTVSSKRS